MAHAVKGPVSPEGEEGAPITLLYLRPGSEKTELDRRLQEIAQHYAPMVELVVVSERPIQGAASPPMVLVLRRGELIGEAMGALLPRRELDRVVRRAVEWIDAPEA